MRLGDGGETSEQRLRRSYVLPQIVPFGQRCTVRFNLEECALFALELPALGCSNERDS